MTKGLANRQRAKNPRKREDPRPPGAQGAAVALRERRAALERLQLRRRGGKPR